VKVELIFLYINLIENGEKMDYEGLAQELLEVMYQMRGNNAQKQVRESIHGEDFVLSYISDHEGTVIPSDISIAMGATSARIAAILNSLEKKGQVTRRIDTEDRRRILIDLTDAGRKHVFQQKQERLRFMSNTLQYLGEEDAKEYLRIMRKLAHMNPEEIK